MAKKIKAKLAVYFKVVNLGEVVEVKPRGGACSACRTKLAGRKAMRYQDSGKAVCLPCDKKGRD